MRGRGMGRIRITYVITWMEMGGTQTHLLQVLRLLDRDRFVPSLYCLTGRGALLDAAREAGVPVCDGGMAAGFRSVGTATGVLRLSRYLRRERVDIVHNYLLRANIFGGVAARLAGVPVVMGSKRGCHLRRGLELVGVRVANRLSHAVMTNAVAVRDFVAANERCPQEKMFVIPSGIDTDRFAPLPADDFKRRLGLDPTRPVVGIVTRMRVRKGVEEFIRALGLVRDRVGAVQGVIVGEVELDPELQRTVNELGLVEHLTLVGRRTDMPEVLSAFDVFVLSSHDEGMSNAILEAMAMERPVVATDVGGTNEVVRDGESGLLVPPKVVEPLAAAIVEVLREPERAAAMGRAGRRIVEEGFSARTMVRKMERVYEDLIRARAAYAALEGAVR